MSTNKIVNVASVPKRSPFRYPGGKTWLVPFARKWWRSLKRKPKLLIEAFAGGGIIGLSAAFEGFVDRVVFVEKDPDVSAVWKCICASNFRDLAERILDFDVTEENVKAALADEQTDVAEVAFRTILKNRMFHGGILAPGASLMKSGENGKGLKSRWYARTLADRIIAIGNMRDRFTVLEEDGISVLERNKRNPDAIYFIDPPYTAAGKKAGSRLYRHSELDHHLLFNVTAELTGDFLMTYDNAEGVVKLANTHNFDMELVAMKNTHHAEMTELLIGRRLDWARPDAASRRQSKFNFESDSQ
jgi:DNA adenine methylase